MRTVSILVCINKTDLTFICPIFKFFLFYFFREKPSYTVLVHQPFSNYFTEKQLSKLLITCSHSPSLYTGCCIKGKDENMETGVKQCGSTLHNIQKLGSSNNCLQNNVLLG